MKAKGGSFNPYGFEGPAAADVGQHSLRLLESRNQPLLPNIRSGDGYVDFRTTGDGACSLHAVFGEPVQCSDGGWELRCPGARAKIAQLLEGRLADLREQLNPNKEFLDAVKSSLWT